MSKFITKLETLATELRIDQINQQVHEVKIIDQAVRNRQILTKAPATLGFAPDEMEEIGWKVPKSQLKNTQTVNNLLNNVRQYLSLTYGIWSLPNAEVARLIKEKLHVNSALEVMAGNAYWSKALKEAGIKVRSTDSLEWSKTSQTGQQPFSFVENLDAVNAVKKYANTDLIICSWSPNFGKSDLELVKARKMYAPQAKLLFIGEKNGATNSPEFWQTAGPVEMNDLNCSFKSYDFIEEKFFEVK